MESFYREPRFFNNPLSQMADLAPSSKTTISDSKVDFVINVYFFDSKSRRTECLVIAIYLLVDLQSKKSFAKLALVNTSKINGFFVSSHK
jgi:hypothetical protein